MMTTIGYVCAENPFEDRKAWSGTIFKLREAIEKAGFTVVWIPYSRKCLSVRLIGLVLKILDKILKIKYLGGVHHPPMVKVYARTIDKNKVRTCDYLFFPGGGQVYLYLNTEVPMISFADATVHDMENYYWKGFSKHSFAMAKRLEKKVAKASAINIRTSQWAIDSVIGDCGAISDHCYVLELGPNIDDTDISLIAPYSGGELRILFSGVDWERKGGRFAIEVVKILRDRGIDSKLIVVGPESMPDDCKSHDFITFYGFLNKNVPSDYSKYIGIFKQSHAFLMPTQAECTGVVFCEATAFGIPSYTFATGGTTNYVLTGQNGVAFPDTASPIDFAEQIIQDIQNKKMSEYQVNCKTLRETRLSWTAFSKRFAQIVQVEKIRKELC